MPLGIEPKPSLQQRLDPPGSAIRSIQAYGPKLDFFLADSQEREWQCGTAQLDFVLPERLDARYIDAEGQKTRPIMIHHAVLGSIERFVGMLLEHYAGHLPFWLAPEQIMVASINDDHAAYADQVAAAFEDEGYRSVSDNRSERLAKKIVDARHAGIPVFITVGEREAQEGEVSLRHHDGQQEILDVKAAVEALKEEGFR